MFETTVKAILDSMGASDSVIAAMGPTATIVLAIIFGGALAQLVKYPISRWIADDKLFSWTVRALAVGSTAVFAHFLSETVPLWLEIGAGVVQPLTYHGSLAIIRRFWPWMENSKLVGSIEGPVSR
jgi:hypothetical protein